jgi:formamidopyrimidine-DNA glycosylase
MPELPEVEVVRAGLEPAVIGAIVTRVEVLDERSLRRHDGPAEDFIQRLNGARFAAPERRGKFLWIPLLPSAPSEMQESVGLMSAPVTSQGTSATSTPAFRNESAGEALVIHLGMSGQVLLRERAAARDRLTRVLLEVEHPEHGPLRVDFVDQRIFGSMALDHLVHVAGGPPDGPAQLVPSQVAHIARDPLDPQFDDRVFLRALARKQTAIKRALLDQTLISGIGNIYADEALWAARVHHEQPTATLSRARAVTLLAEVRLVLGRALAEGGTSFDAQYVNVNGASGYFSHSLNAYGRQGEPCPRCGRPIVRESFMNRGSHFCAFCQRVRARSA